MSRRDSRVNPCEWRSENKSESSGALAGKKAKRREQSEQGSNGAGEGEKKKLAAHASSSLLSFFENVFLLDEVRSTQAALRVFFRLLTHLLIDVARALRARDDEKQSRRQSHRGRGSKLY